MNNTNRLNSTRTSSQRLRRLAPKPAKVTLPNPVPFVLQVAEEISSPMILWDDLLRAEKAKLAFMPELQETEKLFWTELDEIEDFCWSLPTTKASSLWPERSVRGFEKQPAAKILMKGKVVSQIRSNIF